MSNPVEIAVAPLREKAIDRAEQMAKERIAQIEAELIAAGNDINVCAPYPRRASAWDRHFMIARDKHNLFCSLVKRRDHNTYQRPGTPDLCDMDASRTAKYINDCKFDAAAQYDLYVMKLVKKIGACDTAELTGDHVWSYSVLKITKGDKVEHWKTRSIWNVSKLGKVFPQWPTRLMK